MIGREFIGRSWGPYQVEVEKGRLRLFAKVIGETNPIYSDEDAARAAGYRSLPVPPTFLFSLELDCLEPTSWLEELGAPIAKVLHGEQSFHYYSVAVAGDILTFSPRIVDIYSKKAGALEFIVKETRVAARCGGAVADLRSVLVVRHG